MKQGMDKFPNSSLTSLGLVSILRGLLQTGDMATEQNMRNSCDDGKKADEGAEHISDVSNGGHTNGVQDEAENAPGVHERVSNTSFYILLI